MEILKGVLNMYLLKREKRTLIYAEVRESAVARKEGFVGKESMARGTRLQNNLRGTLYDRTARDWQLGSTRSAIEGMSEK